MSDHVVLTATISTLLNSLVQRIHHELQQQSGNVLSSSSDRENDRKAEIVLETSRRKFQVWQKTWIEDVSDPTISADALWGAGGWIDIQKLLEIVQDTAHKFESKIVERENRSKRWWFRRSRASQAKKSPILTVKSPPLLDLALQLSRSMDELWTYSEVAFDSLHGLYAHQLGPPRRERLLTKALHARMGSIALYMACSLSKADYSLEVDLFKEDLESRPVFRRRSSGSSMMPGRLIYHLFAQDRAGADRTEVIILESISKPGDIDIGTAQAAKFDMNTSDLGVYETWPSSTSGFISIKPPAAYAPSYFRISKPSATISLKGQTESLAQLLYKERIGRAQDEERPLSQEAKIQLAFKIVESGLYLLGTPWLASLSSKRVRRMRAQDRNLFVLEIQTLDLEDLYFEDPTALSEHSQLFSIGVLLTEIALSDESNPTNIQDPELRKSKILPLVEKSMGSLYSGATAFCLQDRRPHFDRLDKYRSPEETGWTTYLTELLQDYHAHVFSR